MSNLIIAYLLVLCGGLTRNKYVHQPLILFLAYFFSTRNENVPDTLNYLYKYEHSLVLMVNENLEFGMSLLSYISNDLFAISFSNFIFILTLVLLELWYWTSNRLFPKGHIGHMIILFMSYFGFFYLGITLANAIALIICYTAFSIIVGNRKHSLLYGCILISIGMIFHKSSILFLLAIPIVKLRFSNQTIFLWIFASLFLASINFLPIMDNVLKFVQDYVSDFEEYSNTYEEKKQGSLLTITFLMDLIITVIALIGKKYVVVEKQQIYSNYLNIVLIGLSLYCVLWKSGGITRIAGVFFFYSFILFYLLIHHNKHNFRPLQKAFFTIGVSIFYIFVLLYSQSEILNY